MVPKHVRSPSLFLEAQTALSVELVQTLLHISFGCHCHFWWLLLLCCLNCSSASADNSELPKALRHQQDHQLCHLTQHRHAHSILPLDRPTSTPCSSSAPGTQGTIPPPTEPWDHHLTADLPHNSSSPDMEERLPPARELFVWPTKILTQDLFFKKGLGASLSTPVYPFGSLKCRRNLFKKENQGVGPSKRGRSRFVGFFPPVHHPFTFTLFQP